MSDTMRDTAWKFVPVEPTEAMEIFVHKHAWINAVEAAPAPPVPADVQEIMRLMNPYVRACAEFATMPWVPSEDDRNANVAAAFKPLEAALTALVDENHRLKFELAGVRAMRRPEWQPIETAPKDGEFLVYMPNERAKIQAARWHPNVKTIGGNFAFDLTKPTHWQPMPSPPTRGIEPEQGGNHG